MRHTTTGLLAALTSALLLFPVTAAHAGSGPPPAASERGATSTAPSAKGNPTSTRAQAAHVCADAYQIGSTAYIYRDGAQIASVRQFYSPSCQQNYAYQWVWQSFRDQVPSYDVHLAIYSYTRDDYLGASSWYATSQQEFWTEGTSTVSECTSAVGAMRVPGEPNEYQAVSPKRC